MKRFSKLLILSAVLLFPVLQISGQTSQKEIFNNIRQTAGVYCNYPVPVNPVYTTPPAGYVPFYISHYGRHGSRWLCSAEDYTESLRIFREASENNALTSKGEDVYYRLKKIAENARGRAGDLSPLGVKQHRGISERMFESFPEVFAGRKRIDCRSTQVPRCILSMCAFSERLKELNPQLEITRVATRRDDYMLDTYDTPAEVKYRSNKKSEEKKGYDSLKKKYSDASRFTNMLFKKDGFTDTLNMPSLMRRMWRVASIMQDVDINISLYDIFTKEELFRLWQIQNTSHYLFNGPASGNSVILSSSIPLLRNILDSADMVINGKLDLAASLKFGHDVYLMPLAGLLNLKNCDAEESDPYKIYTKWANFQISPMAGNIQMIFFRKKGSDDILVKFMLNEREVAVKGLKSEIKPYYHWKDVKEYYANRIKTICEEQM
ncbi:MAG: histidine phosphatase family protein [Bacteroidales bacterium]|jgi:hypothetical protein|nr:histidine phosphatase family protein [Bacteroidales bacterium]